MNSSKAKSPPIYVPSHPALGRVINHPAFLKEVLMRTLKYFFMIIVCGGAICGILATQRTSAQQSSAKIYGYTTIDIDPTTYIVSAYAYTESDYLTASYYEVEVDTSIRDDAYSFYAGSWSRNYGFAEVFLLGQGTAGRTYQASSSHTAITGFYDYDWSWTYRYWDYYDYTAFSWLGFQEVYNLLATGPGPLRYIGNDRIVLGTSATAVGPPQVTFLTVEDESINRVVDFQNNGYQQRATLPGVMCNGNTFWVKVTFQLPQVEPRLYTGEGQSNVRLWSPNRFEFLDYPPVSWTGNVTVPAYARFRLRRRSDGGGTRNNFTVTVMGDVQSGAKFRTQGVVDLVCQ